MKLLKIKSRRDFLKIQNTHDIKYHSENFLFLMLKTEDKYIKGNDVIRFGITVTKKIDKRAVVRNHKKRVIREIVRNTFKNNNSLFIRNFDYEIICKKTILNSTFEELKNEFIKSLNNINDIWKQI